MSTSAEIALSAKIFAIDADRCKQTTQFLFHVLFWWRGNLGCELTFRELRSSRTEMLDNS